MPAGILKINGYDAYTKWGISLTQNSISALMTPAPQKARVENRGRLIHGKKVINETPRTDERNLTLEIQIIARTESDFFTKYNSFCTEVLETGYVEIEVKYITNTTFKCYYNSCSQFSEFKREYASFALNLDEPNPKDRSTETRKFNSVGGVPVTELWS